MKLLKTLSLFVFVSFGMNTFAQETSRTERKKALKKNIAMCKILVKKAIKEGNPTKLAQLQAVINRLQQELEALQ